MILLFTKNNPASFNIAKALIVEHGFEKQDGERWTKGSLELIDTNSDSILDVPADLETDLIVVLSTHKSKIIEKVMTAHYPGNWDKADMGGSPRTLNVAAASKLKILLQEIKKEADKIGWNTTLEADHHGPTGKTPIIYAEIGSGEEEWADLGAASAMANAIMTSVKRIEDKNETFETFFGVGGGHYPKTFTKMVLESEFACGHIAPKYAIDSMDEDMFRQAIEKNVEKISKVIVLKDETNRAQKDKIEGFCRKFGIVCEII